MPAPWQPQRSMPAFGWLVIVTLLAVVGCGSGTDGSSAPGSASPTPARATDPPGSAESLAPPTSPAPSPSIAGRDAPPDALLAAEGGDPVAGQLGTYTWLDSGSDAPWLPGAPLAVGAGEPLTVAFAPPGKIATWTARYVPAAAVGPAGSISLGEGAGTPGFAAPEAGSWTVDLAVTFPAGTGSAHYFWRLDVE